MEHYFFILIYRHISRCLYYSFFYQKSMKYWYHNFNSFHNNCLYRICAFVETDKFLRGDSYYKHVFSYSISWYSFSLMTMRRICSCQSDTKAIFLILHFLIPFIILLLIILYLLILYEKKSENLLGINSNSNRIFLSILYPENYYKIYNISNYIYYIFSI